MSNKTSNILFGAGVESDDEEIYDSDEEEQNEELEEEEEENEDHGYIGAGGVTSLAKSQQKNIRKKIKLTEENAEQDDDYVDEIEADEDDDEELEELEDEEDEDLEDKLGRGGEDEIEEEDDNEKYNHYFNTQLTKDYIASVHPECVPVNMEEVNALLDVVRDENGIIVDDFHKTIPFITKYEKARIVGQRAAQLNAGATPYILLEPNVIDGTVIAEMEFNEKKIPAIIKRPLPNGAFEYWRLRDLEILI